MVEKKAIVLEEVVPLSGLLEDQEWVSTSGGEKAIEGLHNPSTFLSFYEKLPESNQMFIIDEAGEIELNPDQLEQFEKIPDILVGKVSEGEFYGDVVNGYKDENGRVYVFPDVTLRAAKIVKEYDRIAKDLKEMTSLSMARGKDIEKKKFLVELEADLFSELSRVVDEQGVSRNLLINLLIQYFLKNPSKLTSELLGSQEE